MAKVVHPNVVTVYDVGVAGEWLFLATEFVDGGTLDAWCRAAPRSWREIVDVPFHEYGEPARARTHVERALATLQDTSNAQPLPDELEAWLARTNR